MELMYMSRLKLYLFCINPTEQMCAKSQWKCSDGSCSASQWVCDSDVDCIDGSDESECGLLLIQILFIPSSDSIIFWIQIKLLSIGTVTNSIIKL